MNSVLKRIQATGHVLRHLLTENPDYRRRWQEHRRNVEPAGLNFAAVAQTIALYLWEAGERSERESTLARKLRDRVRRAVSGAVLTPETLRWFIGAFEFSALDAERLWGAYQSGDLPVAVGISGTLNAGGHLPEPQAHRTLAVFERHRIGPTGTHLEHHAMHVIAALHDNVDRYAYVARSGAVQIEVLSGGTVGLVRPHGERFHVVEVLLTRALRTGETASMEYRAVLPTADSAVVTEVRRIAHGRAERVNLRIEFDPAQLPSRLWWAVWDRPEGGAVVLRTPVDLDDRYSTQRFLPFLEEAVAGYQWEW